MGCAVKAVSEMSMPTRSLGQAHSTGNNTRRVVGRCEQIPYLMTAEYLYAKKDPLPRNCKHSQKKSKDNHDAIYLCDKISNEDVLFFNNSFYKSQDKKKQDSFIALYIETTKKDRERKRNTPGTQKRKRESGGARFFMRGQNSSTKLRICKDFFLRILGGIGRRRVENVASDIFKTGCLRKEKRGGDRKSFKFADRVRKIKSFIQSMPGRESHYGRGKSKKIYLPAELYSIKKLWRLFLQKHPEEETVEKACGVSYKYFLRCVRKFFRIGFGSVKTDTCSYCESHKYKIKNENDTVNKSRLMAELTVHKRRAKVFYELIQEDRPGLKTFSFDNQQNLVLPRVADQQAYYSRQFYVYNFGLVEITPGGNLNPDTVTSYTWTEDAFRKDSSACASAVFDALKNQRPLKLSSFICAKGYVIWSITQRTMLTIVVGPGNGSGMKTSGRKIRYGAAVTLARATSQRLVNASKLEL
ncbi:hypothetical protein EGW08_021845 [Elysia chlorotica]|uniref:Uncharacterized protein n=1 Tax=Elysia chlorotica TaxID=188477 RepID=A0A433SML1_ELYCH|nr:hypothetical protein EGW08_021845 [Elysia chlorotica]